MAADLKRAAEQEEQLADKKQKIEEPADDFEDDSWADAISTEGTTPAASSDKPKAAAVVDASASSAEAAKGATSDTKEAAAVVATDAVTSVDTKEASKDAAPVAGEEAASASSKAPAAAAGDEKAKVQEEAPDLSDSLTVCVKSISYSVEEEQFELDFEAHGEIDEMNFIASRGVAFVTYTTKEAVEAALKMDGDEYWGRKLGVSRADPKKAPPGETFEAFVRGLPVKCEEDALRSHFASCGEIIKIKMRPGEGDKKTTAYVVFKTEEALHEAVKLDAKMFQDSNISVVVADRDRGKGKDKGKGKGKDKGKGKGKGKGKKSKGKSR